MAAKFLLVAAAAGTQGTSAAFVAIVPKRSSWHTPTAHRSAAEDASADSLAADAADFHQRNRRDVLRTLPGAAAAAAALSLGALAAPGTRSASAAAPPATDSYLGPLAALVGTWSGDGGLSVTGVPSRRSQPTDVGTFELIVRPYKEILTIEPIPEAVKNRGGSIEQFSGVVTYKKEVWATDDDPGLIHVEDGMLFYLDNVQQYSDGTPGGKPATGNKPPFAIARSATVPHGNSAMLFGSYKTSSGGPSIPDIDARPIPNDIVGYDSPYSRSPYNAANPNKDLQKAIADQTIAKTTQISLDSRNQGGVTNTPFLRSRADTTGFRCDFWVETVKRADGKTVEQLQYSEFVDILFHKTKKGGADDDLINWPHVMVNTMTKESLP